MPGAAGIHPSLDVTKKPGIPGFFVQAKVIAYLGKFGLPLAASASDCC